jgi:hypothetical protein
MSGEYDNAPNLSLFSHFYLSLTYEAKFRS